MFCFNLVNKGVDTRDRIDYKDETFVHDVQVTELWRTKVREDLNSPVADIDDSKFKKHASETPLHLLGDSYTGYVCNHITGDVTVCQVCTCGHDASYFTGPDVPGSFVENVVTKYNMQVVVRMHKNTDQVSVMTKCTGPLHDSDCTAKIRSFDHHCRGQRTPEKPREKGSAHCKKNLANRRFIRKIASVNEQAIEGKRRCRGIEFEKCDSEQRHPKTIEHLQESSDDSEKSFGRFECAKQTQVNRTGCLEGVEADPISRDQDGEFTEGDEGKTIAPIM